MPLGVSRCYVIVGKSKKSVNSFDILCAGRNCKTSTPGSNPGGASNLIWGLCPQTPDTLSRATCLRWIALRQVAARSRGSLRFARSRTGGFAPCPRTACLAEVRVADCVGVWRGVRPRLCPSTRSQSGTLTRSRAFARKLSAVGRRSGSCRPANCWRSRTRLPRRSGSVARRGVCARRVLQVRGRDTHGSSRR